MGKEKGERGRERELERERGDGEGSCGGEEEGRANYCVAEGKVEELLRCEEEREEGWKNYWLGRIKKKGGKKRIQGHPCPLADAETEEEVN